VFRAVRGAVGDGVEIFVDPNQMFTVPEAIRRAHTFASVAGDLGFSELTIAALLGHAARGVTQRYVHVDESVRMVADRVAGEIARLLDGASKAAIGTMAG